MARMPHAHERLALISDVHGNLTALQAVLADIDARGISRIFNLGDYVGKGPRGREVVDLCQERCEINILGNWDDFLPDPDREFDSDSLRWWAGQLSEGQGKWLRDLPFCHDFSMSGRRIRLFHASETTVHRRVRFDHDANEFAAMFTNTPATGDGPVPSVVGYGDTHDAYYEVDQERRTLASRRRTSPNLRCTRGRHRLPGPPRRRRWPSGCVGSRTSATRA
jgi:predicted phosphodiesterase